jgi:RNA polymerase II subunit A C-terminal domain phosphatase
MSARLKKRNRPETSSSSSSLATAARGTLREGAAPCLHPASYGNMCVSCGARLTAEDLGLAGSEKRSLVLGGGGALIVSRKEARSIETQRADELMNTRRLSLVLDIDHTLLHAVVVPAGYSPPEGVHVLALDGVCFAIKLRPGLASFLSKSAAISRMHLYTNGTRAYAEMISRLIDPDSSLIGMRIVSRSDTASCEKQLSAIFLGDTSMVRLIASYHIIPALMQVCMV